MLNKGDKVIIKPNLKGDTRDSKGIYITNDMASYAGRIAEITSVMYRNSFPEHPLYKIDVDGEDWNWSEEMFELGTEYKISAGTIDATKLLPKKFKAGDRVVVVKINKVLDKDIAGKERFLGSVGIISDAKYPMTSNGTAYDREIEFEELDVQMANKCDGTWLFADDELTFATEVRTVVGGDKIIINYPAIIYILKKNGKNYKGVAKLKKGDVFNVDKGIEIAKTKAEIKALTAKLKVLSK